MKSTGIYHRPIERSFLENNFKVFVINALYSKMYKRKLHKTKEDKLNCISLAKLFFTADFRKYIKPDDIYLNMNALSRQYYVLTELCINLKNRYKNLVYLCFPEYELIFKGNAIYFDIALELLNKYPHANIFSNTRIDTLQNLFKNNNFRQYKRKTNVVKQFASNSYPSVSKEDEIVSSLSQIARLIKTYQDEIGTIKYKLITLGNKTKYFKPINSIFGIGEFTASLIIAEMEMLIF